MMLPSAESIGVENHEPKPNGIGLDSISPESALDPRGCEVQPLFRSLARSPRTGRRTRLPGPAGGARHFVAGAEPGGLRVAVLLWRDAGARDDTGADRLCPRTAQAAPCAERRRGGALS